MLTRLCRARHGATTLIVLVCYLLTGAVVPPGHMAAPLSSGTPFHLCPSDLRSALIAEALAAASRTPAWTHVHTPPAHHDAHHAPVSDHGTPGAASALAQSSVDPGCSFAGAGSAFSGASPLPPLPEASHRETRSPFIAVFPSGRVWLRPPARSPPRV